MAPIPSLAPAATGSEDRPRTIRSAEGRRLRSRSRVLALALVVSTAPIGCFLDATGEASPSDGGGPPTTTSGGGGAAPIGGGPEGGSATGGAPQGGAPAGGGGMGGTAEEGGGGSRPIADCGNGLIEVGEECDDQNTEPADGCHECQVTCPDDEVEHSKSHHCYQLTSDSRNWNGCRDLCDNRPGYYLAALTDESEFEAVATLLSAANWPPYVWVGGFQEGPNDYRWISGEPWGFTPANFTGWKPGEPTDDDGDSEDHIAIWNPSDSTLSWLADATDSESKRCLCEHDAAAAAPPPP